MKLLSIILMIGFMFACTNTQSKKELSSREPASLNIENAQSEWALTRATADSNLQVILNKDFKIQSGDTKTIGILFQNGKMKPYQLEKASPKTSKGPYCILYITGRNNTAGEPLLIKTGSSLDFGDFSKSWEHNRLGDDKYTFTAKEQVIFGRKRQPKMLCYADKKGTYDVLRASEFRGIFGKNANVFLNFGEQPAIESQADEEVAP